MGATPEHNERDTAAPDVSTAPASRHLSRPVEVIVIVTAVLVVLLAIVLGASTFTSSPLLCNGCHEMQPAVASWKQSPHAAVNCYRCHQTPHEWYQAGAILSERIELLRRDFAAHSGSYNASAAAITASALIRDESCLQCHDPSRVPTPRFGVKIQHAKHAKRNKSCVSCHTWTAHPDANSNRASQTMERCFKCHGLRASAKASGECDVCHQEGVDLRPESHRKGDWKADHGAIAKANRKPCEVCHRESSCTGCHKTPIPHPEGWAAEGHKAVGTAKPAICANCHGSPDSCSSCHHKGYAPAKGTWVKQHPESVKTYGASSCRTCHDPAFCVYCHENGRSIGRPRVN